jgi:putative ABC transport system substrate-binding protein
MAMEGLTRRAFGSGGVAATLLWPLVARAQQGTVPVVGFLSGGTPGAFAHFSEAFRRGLADNGFGTGRIAIEQRWAEGQTSRLPALANDLVHAGVALIGAGGPPAALAAKAATTTIPIVFTSGEDPVKLGLVASYNKPAGNVTGVAVFIDVLGAKRIGLVRELVPAATSIVVLLDPREPSFDTQANDAQLAGRALGLQIHILRVNSEQDIDAAFASAKELHAGAMLVGPGFFSPCGGKNWWCWRCVTSCLPSTANANTWLPAD